MFMRGYLFQIIPPSLANKYLLRIIQTPLPFWKLINGHGKDNGLFPSLKLFECLLQSLYTNTKGAIGDSADTRSRSILRSST